METFKKKSDEYNKDTCTNTGTGNCPNKGTDMGREQETIRDSRSGTKLGMQQNAKHILPEEGNKDIKQDNRADTVKEGEQNENATKRNRGR